MAFPHFWANKTCCWVCKKWIAHLFFLNLQFLPILGGHLLHICDSLSCKRWHYPHFWANYTCIWVCERMICNFFIQILQLLPILGGDLLPLCDSLSCIRWHFPTWANYTCSWVCEKMSCEQFITFFIYCHYFQEYVHCKTNRAEQVASWKILSWKSPKVTTKFINIFFWSFSSSLRLSKVGFRILAWKNIFQKTINLYMHWRYLWSICKSIL